MPKDLVDLFFEKKSKDIDKWEHYLAIYERGIQRYASSEQPVSLLEIGVQNGGSLELWAEYLPAGSRIIGIDVDPAVANLIFANPAIEIHILDAANADALSEALGSEVFDVIIDDGSHTSSDIISSFKALFDRLKPGGIYYVEDLHCSYYSSHEGGYLTPHSSIEWLKSLIDAVNYDHIGKEASESIAGELLHHYNRSVASVSFYDSMAVIEKFSSEKLRPFRRIYSGIEGKVQPVRNWLASAPFKSYAPMLFGRATAREIDLEMGQMVRERANRIADLEQRLAERDAQLTASEARVSELRESAERFAATMAKSDAMAAQLVDLQSWNRHVYSALQAMEATIVNVSGSIGDQIQTGASATAALQSTLETAATRSAQIEANYAVTVEQLRLSDAVANERLRELEEMIRQICSQTDKAPELMSAIAVLQEKVGLLLGIGEDQQGKIETILRNISRGLWQKILGYGP